MPEPVYNLEQAEQLLARILGPDTTLSLLESRHGWVARPITESAANSMGTAAYVIDKKTGVVTRHPSLSLTTIGNRYDQAIANGLKPPGRRIHPPQHRIQLTLTSEEQTAVEYRVLVKALDPPTESEAAHQLRITKNPLHCQPTDSASATATDWAVRQFQTTGEWPRHGTIEL
ncbi:hypothetical protein ACFVVM_28835 [Nocardia sp. NPDC058176]|uniref:hypothetical protein n=1 Tax=Nocardia sp. NPDC058176 TaxID=3346368 RepID=UPI0036D90E72